MNNVSNMPVEPGSPASLDAPALAGQRSRRGRFIRWGIGVTVAGALAGGAAALATGGASANAAGQPAASTAQLNALLSVSGQNQSGQNTASTDTSKIRPLNRLRGLGGMYGSFAIRTASGTETLAFERGTIGSVSGSNIVVRAADGTTMTWQLVSDTLVRDHGKSSTSQLSDGQLVFVGGPVSSGARDARLIVIRAGGSHVAAGRVTAQVTAAS
jgi:hypothetical protein